MKKHFGTIIFLLIFVSSALAAGAVDKVFDDFTGIANATINESKFDITRMVPGTNWITNSTDLVGLTDSKVLKTQEYVDTTSKAVTLSLKEPFITSGGNKELIMGFSNNTLAWSGAASSSENFIPISVRIQTGAGGGNIQCLYQNGSRAILGAPTNPVFNKGAIYHNISLNPDNNTLAVTYEQIGLGGLNQTVVTVPDKCLDTLGTDVYGVVAFTAGTAPNNLTATSFLMHEWDASGSTPPTLDSMTINGTATIATEDIKVEINHTDPQNLDITEYVNVFHNYTSGDAYHYNDTFHFTNDTTSTNFHWLNGNYTNNVNITFRVILSNSIGVNSSAANRSRYIGNYVPNLDSITVNDTTQLREDEDLLISINGSDNNAFDTISTYLVVFRNDEYNRTMYNSTTGTETVNNTLHFLSGNFTAGENWTFQGIVTDTVLNSTQNTNVTKYIWGTENIWFSWTPSPAFPNSLTTFNSSSYFNDILNNESAWEWSWGDWANTTADNQTGFENATHTYLEPGEYTVGYNVTDYWGTSNSTSRNITMVGVYVKAFNEEEPTTNISFNVTFTNSTNTFTVTSVPSGVFIWNNASSPMPTGSITIKVISNTYQQREYADTLDETTYVRINAYLLPTASGVTQPFVVRDNLFAAIEGATIVAKKTVAGVLTTVSEKETDSTGGATMFLDPDDTHTIEVSAGGYNSESFQLNPSTDTKYVTLGGGGKEKPFEQNDTAHWDITPSGNKVNNSTSKIIVEFYDPNCGLKWMEVNITNETGTPFAQKDTATDPCYMVIECEVYNTVGLKDLYWGSKIEVDAEINWNTTDCVGDICADLNRTYYTLGATEKISAAAGLEILKGGDFSDAGMAFIAIVFITATAGGLCYIFGFGGGLISALVAGIFWVNGFIWTDVFFLSLFVALLSLAGKRWK